MEETAVESNGGKKAGVSGKARGQKIAAHVTTVSFLVTGEVKQMNTQLGCPLPQRLSGQTNVLSSKSLLTWEGNRKSSHIKTHT